MEFDEPKDQRIVILLGKNELARVDDWRFQHRISSRGEAIRKLLSAGMFHWSKVDAKNEKARVKRNRWRRERGGEQEG